MTLTSDPKSIFQDAHSMYQQALNRLGAGDIRDAAEKAWCATVLATNALVLARTGEVLEKTRDTSKAIHDLVVQDRRIEPLIGRYHTRANRLHGDCFYWGLCDPVEDVERRIRETIDYIRDAEELARSQN